MNTIILDMHMNMHMNMNMNMCMCMLCTLWYFWVPSRALILLRGEVEKSTNCCGPRRLFVGRCGWVYYCRGWWVWVGGFYLGRTSRRRAAPAATIVRARGLHLERASKGCVWRTMRALHGEPRGRSGYGRVGAQEGQC